MQASVVIHILTHCIKKIVPIWNLKLVTSFLWNHASGKEQNPLGFWSP